MITTVTLNAAIDKTYYLDRFPLGKVSRVAHMTSFPGGKGINVARVARRLGGDTLATGFVGGHNGAYILQELAKQGIRHDFVQIEEESRICLNIIDRSDGTSTEVLEPGPTITSGQAETMKRKIRELASRSGIVAFSGSLPKGLPATFYAELIDIAKSEGALAFLDTSGEALAAGVRSLPFFIKPNEDEMAQLLGKPVERESDLYGGIRRLMDSGIDCIVVSLGEKGAVAGFQGRLYRVIAPRVEAVNTVGCGDSFVAGMAVAMSQKRPFEECLRLAAAAGSANALTEEAGNVRPEDVQRLSEQVRIEPIEA